MISSTRVSIGCAIIHLRHANLDDQISVEVARDLIVRKIKNAIKEENIDFDALSKLNTLYTALNAVYDSFEK